MRQIFKEADLDVEILGDKRLQNFSNLLLSKAQTESDFEYGRTSNGRKENLSTEAQMAKRIRELEHRNDYLEQENEFFKKIHSVETDAMGRRAV